MRLGLARVVLAGGLLLSGVRSLQAQEPPTAQESAEFDRVGKWKLINTALFAVLLGWMLAKTAPKFFNARSADIQKAIQDATGLKLEADFRYSSIDKKMATLDAEVRRIRDQAAIEMEREHERVRQETKEERERVQHHVQAEIEALRGESISRLQRETAQAALALSEQQLRNRVPSQGGDFTRDFVALVEGSR